jgi:hypothetical protein
MNIVKELLCVVGRTVAARTSRVTLAIGIVAMASCASDATKSGPPVKTATAGGASDHAIHVFVKAADGSEKQVDFGPGTDIHGNRAQASGSLTTRNVHLAGFDEGGTALQPAPTIGAPGSDITETAWMLLERAAVYCSQQSGPGGIWVGATPWSDNGDLYDWFIYAGFDNDSGDIGSRIPTSSCSERLEYEENLLCVADQLGAIADAVGTTVWPALDPGLSTFSYSPDAGGSDAGPALEDFGRPDWRQIVYAEWDIPPQADQDRFIVRDLAIHTLGILATLDATPVPTCPTAGGGTATCTCASLLGDIAEVGSTNPTTTTPVSPVSLAIDNSAVGNQWSELAFGVPASGNCGPNPPVDCFPFYPPSKVPIWDSTANHSYAPDIARSALQIESHILRAGGRLLHDLVRRDVYSDLAAAAGQSAQALDPAQGNALVWGQVPSNLYGTYAHATRVLAGRWEIGDGFDAFNYHGDPMCEGQTALNVLPNLFGDELSARVQDVPIRTKGEALAADIVGGAGIVVPTCALSQTTASTLRSALVDQLVLSETPSNGLSAAPPRAPFDATVSKLSDSEVVFGFGYALRTYRLLTDSADIPAGSPCTTLPANGAGLTAGAAATSISSAPLYGTVIAGGLSRQRLVTDPIARSGGLLEASQCIENWGIWTEWGTTSTVVSGPLTYGEGLPASVFQDAFHIGQALERRLVELQIASTPVAQNDPGAPQSVARGAIAELRNWAGSMLVQWYGTGTALAVRISGEDFSDLGLSGPDDPNFQTAIQSAFGFVYGPPWAAECAAHVRADCPDHFDPWTPPNVPPNANSLAGWVQHPSNVTADLTGNDNYLYGAVPPVFTLMVPYYASDPNRSTKFLPPQTPFGASNSHLYMVRIHDPKSPGGRGEVLGVMTTNEVPYGVTSFVVAPMQRELLENTVDLGKWIGAKPPKIGDLTAADTPGSCIDGVPRDLFVPLQNQLSSGSVSQGFENSWQYYLNAAKEAAATADGFGQQLIALDLQVAQNEQAAGEQVAALCGDYGALSNVSIDPNGHVTPAANDPTLNQCLNPPTTDIVFVSTVPAELSTLVGGTAPTPTTPAVATTHDAIRWIQTNPLHCDATNSDPLCSSTIKQISYNYLNIIPPTPPRNNQSCAALPDIESSRGKGFKGTKFLGLLKDPMFASSGMQALASSLHMNVNLFDNWQVTYGSAVLMDTTPGNPEVWPGCLPGCDFSNPVVSALDVTFRYGNCGHFGCDGLAFPVPDFGTQQAAEDAAEMNLLRWRVAGALQMIAASAGEMPQKMFNMPVPAVLMPTSAGSPPSATAFVGEVYSGATGFWQSASGAQMDPNGGPPLSAWTIKFGNSEDISALNTVYDVAPGWMAFPSHAGSEIPAWYMNMYSPGAVRDPKNGTKHALTGNAPVAWTNCDVAAALGMSGCSTPGGSGAVSFAQVLGQGAWNLDGLVCPSRWGGTGDPTGPAGPVGFVELVDALKTGYDRTWAANNGTSDQGFVGRGVASIVGDCTSQGPGLNFSCVSSNWDQAGAQPLWQVAIPGMDVSTTEGLGYCNPPGSSGAYCASLSRYPSAQLPPWDRVVGFVNLVGENGVCDAVSQLVDAAAVACSAQTMLALGATVVAAPPSVESMGDVIALQAWVRELAAVVGITASSLYTEHVPNVVVSDLRGGSTGSGNKAGEVGADTLNIEQALQDIPSGWSRLASDVTAINSAIQAARLGVQMAGLQDEDALQKLAFSGIQIQGQMMQGVSAIITQVINYAKTVAAVTSCAATEGATCALALTNATIGVIGAAGGGAATVDTSLQELDNLAAQASTANEVQRTQIAQAITTLSSTTSPLWADVQTALDNLRKAVLSSMQASAALQAAESKAAYQSAIASGNDTAVLPSGQEIPIPVNTVLNRQMSATAIRYQRALTNAKALAYMARRAIEQRIGRPLSQFTENVGPLERPASWADDVCSLTGIDYKSLATPTFSDAGGQTGAAEQKIISRFANSFVGDYVAKLQNMVDYFNVYYPSHEGSDTAVLSLRYDLLNPLPECTGEASNRLYYSGELSHLTEAASGAPGWRTTACAAATGKCLAALPGAILPFPSGPAGALQNPSAGTGAAFSDIGNGVTWLTDVAQSSGMLGDAGASEASVADAGTGAADGGPGAEGGGESGVSSEGGAPPIGPPGLVFQAVTLDRGSYVLSWWDQARDQAGNLPAAGVVPTAYVVQVYDPSWSELATYDELPFVADPEAGAGANADADAGAALWSARHALAFNVGQAGTYYVAFGASTADEGLGSVAIADVQLELTTGNNVPSAYVQTGDTRNVLSFNCTPSDSDMRAAFQHNCDESGTCWYDLTSPVVIDTQQLQNGTSPISGKLAPGNYNFRHVDLAVNLVGTGVHDCSASPTPDCYGSAYIQYTLTHDGTSSEILDWDGKSYTFDFGLGSIRSGKALSAERYITLPIGSNDQALLNQQGIQHIELRGRPLDGAYSLRIWDSPSLKWDRLEDVQIVLDYLYWSEVVANSNAQGQ